MRTRYLPWSGLSALVVGCTQSEPHLHKWPTPPAASAITAQHRGGGKWLTADDATLAPTAFVQRVNELLASGAQDRCARYIARHPDTALAALRAATSADANTAAVLEIAHGYDQQCVSSGQSGWSALLADRAMYPHKYTAYEQQRATLSEHLRSGRIPQAAAVALTSAVPREMPNPLLTLDAAQLTATAALLQDQPKAALTALATATPHASLYPHQSAYVLLLQSEAQRRTNQATAADASWTQAVALTNDLLAEPTTDPTLWDRCSYLRPVQAEWPTAVCLQLAHHTGLPLADASVQTASHTPTASALKPGESQVWACIGMARLQRGEPELALAALKQAESWATAGPARSRLQLAQAQALLDLEQPGPATAVLVRLATDPATAAPAQALLGSLRLQQKAVQEALPLLRRAVEDNHDQWPGRAQAEANLGLVLLITGDEPNGRKWLHTAQDHFAAEGATEQLRQALLNEMNYLAKKGQTEPAAALRARLAQMPGG